MMNKSTAESIIKTSLSERFPELKLVEFTFDEINISFQASFIDENDKKIFIKDIASTFDKLIYKIENLPIMRI